MGLYKRKRLSMGLASAPGAFQNLMELIMSGLSYEVALVYLDDIIIFGRSFEEHLNRLYLVLGRLKDAGLKILEERNRLRGTTGRVSSAEPADKKDTFRVIVEIVSYVEVPNT